MTVRIERQNEVAVVTIENPPVNAASQEVRQGLVDAVAACNEDPNVKAVVLICAGRTFVAGADIREFGKPPMPPHLPDVVSAIENATKPWMAALHGTALGGGLEIAMGCHARIAVSDARMGLPEVNLGLIPGAGGTVRLPRLVSAEFALQMVAGGKPVSAHAALEAGLIDQIVDGDLLVYAVSLARDVTLRRTSAQCVNTPSNPETYSAAKASFLKKARGQLSIQAAVDAIDRAFTLDFEQALTEEREAFQSLKASEQSAALRHIFFAERATTTDPRCRAETRRLENIGIVGGGTMGVGIAAACLLAGLRVTMIERDKAAASDGRARVLGILDQSLKRGLIPPARRSDLENWFKESDSYLALSDTDLVIEAVFEDMNVKSDVFAELDRIAPANAILATNTSYLDVNEIAETIRDPSRVIGLHFFSPAHIMKLLEIVVPNTVADDVLATATQFAKRLGKTPVLSGVCDGFIGNRIMSAYRREADYLIEDGALPWDVDRAMRDFGFAMGVFEMQDLAGLDIAWAMRKRRAATRDPAERYVEIADRLCEAGHFGRKTGRGWYLYEDGKALPEPETQSLIENERRHKGIHPTTISDDEIMKRILSAMQREGAAVMAEGIAQKSSDIDVTMISGYGFPRWRGGPMFIKKNR